MKAPILRILAVTMLLCVLAFSMTGCEDLDYRDAIDLYNDGDFEAAAEIFYALGDFENSSALYTDCQYWIAANLAEEGNFEQALPRFIKLDDYQNSPQWVTECKYQMAVAAFNAQQYADAGDYFLDIPDYKNTREYLRQINWQKLYDTVKDTGTIEHLHERFTGRISIDPDNPARLLFSITKAEDNGYAFRDDLRIFLTRESLVAEYTAESIFVMELHGKEIGSTQTSAGKIDITTCTPETQLVVDTYEKAVTDNHGYTTTSTDPADSLMTEAMMQNLRDLLTMLPELLLDAGIPVTLQDIGFAAL